MLNVVVAQGCPGGNLETTIGALTSYRGQHRLVTDINGVSCQYYLLRLEMLANPLAGASLHAVSVGSAEASDEPYAKPDTLIIFKPLCRPEESDSDPNQLKLVAIGVLIDLIRAELEREGTFWVESRPQQNGTATVVLGRNFIAERNDWLSIPKYLAGPFVDRVKIMAGIPLAEKNSVQEGMIMTPCESCPDLGVETSPSMYGEIVRFS